MTGPEFKKYREHFGLDRLAMARLIGYTGTERNDIMRVRRLESGGVVPLYIARLVYLINYVVEMSDHGSLPTFPDWPGYNFDHSPDPQHEQV